MTEESKHFPNRGASKDGTYVERMVAEWLLKNGYEGLCDGDECGCGLDDLMPCGCAHADCGAAYRFECRRCAWFDDCCKRDGYDVVYSCDSSWCGEYELASDIDRGEKVVEDDD